MSVSVHCKLLFFCVDYLENTKGAVGSRIRLITELRRGFLQKRVKIDCRLPSGGKLKTQCRLLVVHAER